VGEFIWIFVWLFVFRFTTDGIEKPVGDYGKVKLLTLLFEIDIEDSFEFDKKWRF
jgi:hypothetical protein